MRPSREIATNNGQTYFVTSNSAGRKPFFAISAGPDSSLKHSIAIGPNVFSSTVLY